MSYDVHLVQDGAPVCVPCHFEGGACQVGGSTQASLSVTYNYAWFYYHFLDGEEGLRWLYGKQGRECIPRLERAVEELGIRRHQDYWADTPGNAGFALSVLLAWAKQYPDAIFESTVVCTVTPQI